MTAGDGRRLVVYAPRVQKQENRKCGRSPPLQGGNDEHVGAFRARAAWASPTCIRGFLKWVASLIPVVRCKKETRRGTYRSDRTQQSYDTRASADQADELGGITP